METYYLGVSQTVIAPAQTVCDVSAAKTLTVVSVQPQVTKTKVTVVTSNTIATVWVGYVMLSIQCPGIEYKLIVATLLDKPSTGRKRRLTRPRNAGSKEGGTAGKGILSVLI